MAGNLEVTKIDAAVMAGLSSGQEGVSKADAGVLVGMSAATLGVAKIDSYTMVGSGPAPTQHENVFAGQWIGPPKKLGT